MRITLASDPGKSGGYAVAFGSLDKVELYPWSEEDEFLAYLNELVLRDHAVRLFPSLKGVTLKTCDALLILNHHLSH